MSRSKRRKKTRMCACGMRIEAKDRPHHDMCFDKRPASRNNEKVAVRQKD